MMITADMLNTNQRKAVEWGKGPLLVLAGPGSGKTAVLTLRIANLIKNSPEENYRILGLTFTVKAANEMQNRIRDLLGNDSKRVQLCTFHSFCADILGQHGSLLGLQPDFQVIIDDKDRIAILKDINDSGQIEVNDPERSLKLIDTMFKLGIMPYELPKYFKDGHEAQCKALQNLFESYIRQLVNDNQLDFGSMLFFTRELLASKPRVARQVRTVYQYVCVDEFQDTNLAQYKILRLLCPEATSNLFVVADDDQIIFQWNGADPKRLDELKNDYSPEIVQLPENYRCPVEVVEIANRLIAHNPRRIGLKKEGIAHKTVTGAIQLKSFYDFNEEIQGLISEIEQVPQKQRETCLVIARSNKLLMQVRDKMVELGMNAEIVSKSQEFASPQIQLIYYSMKLANTPESRSLLNKLCSSAGLVDGNNLSAEDVAAKAQVEGMTLLRAFFALISERNTLKPLATYGISFLCDALDYMSFVQAAIEIFDSLNQGDGLGEAFPDYDNDKAIWERIVEQIRRMRGDNVSLHLFLQEMDLSPKAKTLSKDCVRLQTVHTAKGIEFDNVYVIGLAEEPFPTYLAIKNGDSAIQEERRNCFVAITRTSKNLYLSFAGRYFGWSKKPSRFLHEMGLIDG